MVASKEDKVLKKVAKASATAAANNIKNRSLSGHNSVAEQTAVNKAIQDAIKEALMEAGVKTPTKSLRLIKTIPGLGDVYNAGEFSLYLDGEAVEVDCDRAEEILDDYKGYIVEDK